MKNSEIPLIGHLKEKNLYGLRKLLKRRRSIEHIIETPPDNALYKECLADAGKDPELAKTLYAIRTDRK